MRILWVRTYEKRLAHVRALCQIVRAKKECVCVCVNECPSIPEDAVKYLFSKTQFLSGFPTVPCTNNERVALMV